MSDNIPAAQPKNPPIYKTSCRDCVFANYVGDTQTGCELQRLERFAVHGGYDMIKDEKSGKQHAMINRYCNGCHNNRHPDVKGLSVDEAKAAVRQKTRLQHTFVVFFRDGDTRDQLREFIESCNNQTLAPIEIHVINTSNDLSLGDFLDVTVKPGIIWQHTKDKNAAMAPEAVLDSVLGRIKGDYYSIFRLPQVVHPEFIERLNVAINYRMERFVALEGDEAGNGETFMTKIARSYHGNVQEDFTDLFTKPETADGNAAKPKKRGRKKRVKVRGLLNKLRYVAEQTGRQYQVKKISDYVW